MGLYNDHCYFLLAMVGWFAFSALLSSYNKIVFGKENMDFPCPLLMTSIHFLIQWVYSYTVSSFFPKTFGHSVASMPWYTYLMTSIPCELVTSFDVGLSNLALVRISISFYTMVKASAPIFVLLSAYAFNIEKITWNLVMIVGVICVGEILTVEGELEFDVVGFCMCLGASVLSGFRWTTVQFTIQSLNPPLKTPLETMRLLSTFMCGSMLILSVMIEKPWEKFGPNSEKDYFADADETLKTACMAVIGGLLAVCMITCEFWLIMQSSAMVLMIGGVCKEVVTIMMGVVFFGDSLNRTNMAGCTVIFMGVILYKLSYKKMKKEKATLSKSLKADYQPVNLGMADHNSQMNNLMENDVMRRNDCGIEANDIQQIDDWEEIETADKWDRFDRSRNELEDKPSKSIQDDSRPIIVV